MTPDGTMVLLQNEDLPGMIGHVGSAFGEAKVNIADMTISRRDQGSGKPTAMRIEEIADVYAFALANLGVQVPERE